MRDPFAGVIVGASGFVNDGVCSTGSTGDPQCVNAIFDFGSSGKTATLDYVNSIDLGEAHASVSAYQGGQELYSTSFGFADPPYIKGSARAINTDDRGPAASGASFGASVTDGWSLGGSVPATPGQIVVRFKLTGDVFPSGGASYCLTVQLQLFTAGGSYCSGQPGNTLTPTLAELDLATFELVGVFDDLSTLTTPGANQSTVALGGEVRAESGAGEVSLNLGSTFVLELIAIRDLDGNLIPGVTWISESGAAIALLNAPVDDPPVGVPAPGGLGLLGIGAVAVMAWRRRSARLAD